MAAKKGQADPEVSVGEIARILMIGEERVRQLAKDKWIPRVGRGKYPLAASVQGYIRFLKDESRRSTKVAADALIKNERARALKLKNDRDEGRLIDTEESLGTLDEIIGELRSRISAVPARVTRDLKLREKIETEIDAAFTRAADALAKAADRHEAAAAAQARGATGEAGEEDDS